MEVYGGACVCEGKHVFVKVSVYKCKGISISQHRKLVNERTRIYRN